MCGPSDRVAGDEIEILAATGTHDLAECSDRASFAAHLSLAAGLDPTCLDRLRPAAARAPDVRFVWSR
jgi:hypothetical protein